MNFDYQRKNHLRNCIVINETVQHFLPEVISSLQNEIKRFNHYAKELTSDYLVTGTSEHNLRKPFLRLLNSEVPPSNADTVLRTQRNEFNLSDLRSTTARKWLKSECVTLINATCTCIYNRQVQTLEEKRNILLCKLTKVKKTESNLNSGESQSSSDNASTYTILSNLKETELKLKQMENQPSSPPKWLVYNLARFCLNDLSSFKSTSEFDQEKQWEQMVVSNDRSGVRQTIAKKWFDIFSIVDNVLRSSDWVEIANKANIRGVNEINARLVWIHKFQPSLNRTDWSEEEDLKLKDLVDKYGEHGHWETISSKLGSGRTVVACFRRWQTVMNENFTLHRSWSVAEDTALLDILKNLVNVYSPGLMDWELVAAYHPTRSPVECHTRACNICPAFQMTCPKKPNCLKLNKLNQSQLPTGHPFSLQEDLQLLMAVQRYGIAGGRIGTGTGYGVGSWALITTALPGRNVRTCQRRYIELCEQYQPWTYAEDRKLYRLLLQNQMKDMNHYIGKRVFTELLPHFPGRSTQSLDQRYRTLKRWAKLWRELRNALVNQINVVKLHSELVSGERDSCSVDGSKLMEESRILLYSPFAAQFIAQLRKSGVSNAEDEAFRLLTTWKNRQLPASDSLGANSPNLSSINPTDMDFIQLLDDLDGGLLVPSARVGSDDGVKDSDLPENDVSNSEFQKLSCRQAKWLVLKTQMKQVLVGPVRRFLTHLTTSGDNPVHEVQYFTRKRQLDLSNPSRCLLDHTKMTRRDFSCRKTRAQLLLDQDHLFWKVFDQVIRLPKISALLKQTHKVATLSSVAPEIANQMILHLYYQNLKQFPLPTQSRFVKPKLVNSRLMRYKVKLRRWSKRPRPACPNRDNDVDEDVHTASQRHFDDEPPKRRPTDEDLLSDSKRQKLIQIRRLLTTFGSKQPFGSNPYALVTNVWNSTSSNQSQSSRQLTPSSNDRFMPPVLRSLPTPIATHLFNQPDSVRSKGVEMAQACLDHALHTANSVKRPPFASLAVENQANCDVEPINAQILPPNYATLLAFKSLILHMPNLLSKSKDRLTQFVELRQLFSAFPGQTITDEEFEKRLTIIQTKPFWNPSIKVAASSLFSVNYLDFLSRSLAILLWPALLASIPARRFVEAGKRCWQKAFEYSLELCPPSVPKPITYVGPSKSAKRRRRTNDYPLVTSNYRRCGLNIKRKNSNLSSSFVLRKYAGIRASKQALQNMTTFHIKNEGQNDQSPLKITLNLPEEIRILYACGFRPDSIVRLTK